MILEKHFMVDIEATGVDLDRDDILEVAFLECDYVDGFWRPGRTFEGIQSYKGQPVSEFAKKHMSELYSLCNQAEYWASFIWRSRINDFFRQCGVQGQDVYLMGWNASNFDVPMLNRKGWLEPPGYRTKPDGTDQPTGDHHYRIYELGGALSLAQNVLSIPRKDVIEKAKAAYDMEMPPGKEHRALWDCYSQLRFLNGLIKLIEN